MLLEKAHENDLMDGPLEVTRRSRTLKAPEPSSWPGVVTFISKHSSGQEKLLLITFPHSSTPLELTILVCRRLSIFPHVFPCRTCWFSRELLPPRALPVCDCIDLDSNFLSLQVLGPSQADSQQTRIDRQPLYVSRLIESLGSAVSVALVFDLIHPPAWPSRLFDIQGSLSRKLTHAAMLLPLRLRKFSPNRERAMAWAGATPARVSCIQDPDGRLCKPCPL